MRITHFYVNRRIKKKNNTGVSLQVRDRTDTHRTAVDNRKHITDCFEKCLEDLLRFHPWEIK